MHIEVSFGSMAENILLVIKNPGGGEYGTVQSDPRVLAFAE